MGTFIGHVIPGTFFFIYGIFYVVRDAFSSAHELNNGLPEHPTKTDPGTTANDGAHTGTTSEHWGSLEFEFEEEETSSLYSRDSSSDILLRDTELSQGRGADKNERIEPTCTDSQQETSVTPTRVGCCTRCFANIISILEGIVKLVLSLGGAMGELWWVNWYMFNPRTGNFTNMNNWQHATMYGFFLVSGLADIVFHTCLTATTKPNNEKLFLSLAFWVEGILFMHHTEANEELEAHLHLLLLLPIFMCAVGTGLEPWSYHPATPGVRRLWVAALCLQGTWFWQIAFVLYNPWKEESESPWKASSLGSLTMITTMFAWHILFVILISLVIHSTIRCCSKSPRCCKNK